MRVCRPYGIVPKDLKMVIEEVIASIGRAYDNHNLLEIGIMLLQSWLNPIRRRSIKLCVGGCDDFQVICSGLIAKAFQSVGYPIIPAFAGPPQNGKDYKRNPYGSKLIMRHYSQILPRDFDLSPNFEIIKFNFIKSGKFDYKAIWADENP